MNQNILTRTESQLAFYGLAPFLLIIVTAAGVPLSAELTEFNITPYRHLIMSLAMLFIPLILGVMSGFILLDERDRLKKWAARECTVLFQAAETFLLGQCPRTKTKSIGKPGKRV